MCEIFYTLSFLDKINKMSPELCYNDKSNLENEIEQIGQIIGDTKKIQIVLEKKLNQYKNQIKKQFLGSCA